MYLYSFNGRWAHTVLAMPCVPMLMILRSLCKCKRLGKVKKNNFLKNSNLDLANIIVS